MTNSNLPKCVVLYRWKLKPELEQQFIESWSKATAELLLHGSCGSRLHKGSDGIWYGYAQWPSAETRERAFANYRDMSVQAKMSEAVAESLPPIFLEPVADYLRLPI